MPRVGVLALQGDVREHVAMLHAIGVTGELIKRPEQLEGLDGIIFPGGESTTMAHLLATSGLQLALEERVANGLPVLGTCAGLSLLSHKVLDGRDQQWSLRALDVIVRRNGYGRQIASFESPVDVKGVGVVPGVFIRAPRIEAWGKDVEVLAKLDHGDGPHPVLVRQGAIWGCSFHPELTNDSWLHQMFTSSL